MSEERQKNELEETIEPIRPTLTRVGREAAKSDQPSATRPRSAWIMPVVGGVLMLGLGLVFFVLPRVVEPPAEESQTAVDDSIEASTPPEPGLTTEEIAALESRIQEDLAALLTQQEQLETLSASTWADADWTRYIELSQAGDDAYLASDLEAAAGAYAAALDLGNELLERENDLVAAAIAEGGEAFEGGDWAEALRRYNFVLGIEPENAAALRGKRRSEQLPDVLEQMRSGDEATENGDFPTAIASYRRALAIDSEWLPARQALRSAEANLSQYEFEQALSRGYAALGESAYGDAVEHFSTALAIQPDSEAAQDGLYQAEEGIRLGAIALAEIRALAFERRELWDQAITQYQTALETDPTLQYAIEGLERARNRQDLDVKLQNLIENPRLLFDDGMLAEAERLLEQAGRIDEKGQRVSEQISELSRLMQLASTPLPVMFESDELTEVIIYRVGELGTFLTTQLELRPGEYTAIGSRNGYRDVRMRFTVLPGRDLEPIRIVCVEPI